MAPIRSKITAAEDKIDLTASGITNFSDLSKVIHQVGPDTIISLGSGLVLEKVDATALTSAQFVFNNSTAEGTEDHASVAEDASALINVLANDTDANGKPLVTILSLSGTTSKLGASISIEQ